MRARIYFSILILLLKFIGQLNSQTCSCKEFIYVNEPNGVIHKMEINPSTGIVTEVGGVNGIPWLNNPGVFPFPHGLGVDRNGFLFIGTNFGDPNNIRKLDCTGNLFPETGTTGFRAPSTGDWGILLTNIQSYDGFIYANGPNNRIYKIDPCTGNTIGYVVLGIDGSDDWGLYIDKNGKFYATQPTGKIFAFTPTATNFTSNTVFPLFIDLGANPTYGGLSPQYSGTGLQGIVTDIVGNIYVVEGDRDALGTPSRLLKFSSTGTFLGAGPIDSNGGDNMGWNQMVGIVYSETSNKLYTTSLNPNEDCVYKWNTDLSPDGAAVGPVPNAFGQCKAIGILSECCPQSETIVKSACGVSTGDQISLSELLECDGVVCEGQWAAVAGNTNLTFNECDLTLTVGPLPACGSFTITNTGLTGTLCQPYSITLELSFLASITAQVISGNQTVCPTDDPAPFTVTTNASTNPPGATITYQWQQSTTSATTGFSNISGAQSATYNSGPVSQTTYFRVIASISGCTGGTCRDTSNVVVLTLQTVGCGPQCNLSVACNPLPQTSCTPPNGSATTTLTGAQGNISYLWSSGETTSSISGKNAGTYTVTVTDDFLPACTSTCQAIITSTTTLPTATCAKTDNTNCATPNGTASVTTDATSPTYLWSNTTTTASISGLSNGTYTVTVTNTTTGCTNTCQAIVANATVNPTCNITANTQPSCADLTGGSITVNPSPAGTYTYNWSDIGSGGANRTGLSGGTYTVTVTNTTTNCTGVCNVTLTTPTNCCNIAAIVPQNLECLDNGTPGNITDNRIRFNALVTNTNASLTSYNVTINGGTTITPNMNVPYGVTQFTLGPGSAGGGATFTVTVTDSATPGCTQTFQVIDPGTCNPAIECPTPQCGSATIQTNGN